MNGDLETEKYKEGIYVGYRYFDSFGIWLLFPFGYGFSYTAFCIKFEGLWRIEKSMNIMVSIKNTGNFYSGREVVQVYVTLPQTTGAKEYQRLVGFAKTDMLKLQEKQKFTVSIDQSYFASYSEKLHA